MQDGAAADTGKRMKPSLGTMGAVLSQVSRNFSGTDQEERHCRKRNDNLYPWWVCDRAALGLDTCTMYRSGDCN